jgi:hypothetical protein
MNEKDTQRTITDYLTLKRIFWYRNNSGAMVSEYKGVKRFMRFGATGSPDIICVFFGRFVGIEVKTESGKQSEHQKAFAEKLRKAGGEYILARKLEDVRAFFEKGKDFK